MDFMLNYFRTQLPTHDPRQIPIKVDIRKTLLLSKCPNRRSTDISLHLFNRKAIMKRMTDKKYYSDDFRFFIDILTVYLLR